jgi:hypothetical protein
MADTTEEGPHIHQPCSRCGLVEAEVDGLCPECATQLAEGTPAYDATGQGPDAETAELERP